MRQLSVFRGIHSCTVWIRDKGTVIPLEWGREPLAGWPLPQ